jgi:quinol monooxygenase YgiN
MLSFMLNVKVKPEHLDRAQDALGRIDTATQGHKGKITFSWFRHLDDQTRFTLFEQWEDQQCLDAHVSKIIDIWNEFTPYLDGSADSTQLLKLVQ